MKRSPPGGCVNINRELFMAESRAQSASSYKPIRAPRGLELSCKGWQQEAALRLLMNSVDPAIAEHPQELIVSGGIGKLARDWQAFYAIIKSLQALADDETLHHLRRRARPDPENKSRSPPRPRREFNASAVLAGRAFSHERARHAGANDALRGRLDVHRACQRAPRSL